MSLKNIYFYPEAESSVSLKIKLSYGSRMYNYTIVSVAVSNFTRELREIEEKKKKKHPEEKQGLSPVRLKDVIVLLHDTSIFHSKDSIEISVMINTISLSSPLDPILF